jgi:hypothetical protein
MIKETEYIRSILPVHYICESRKNGVHCYSSVGINDSEHWFYIMEAIKQKFEDRFMEVYHQTCTNHLKFTVYLKSKFIHQALEDINNGKILIK